MKTFQIILVTALTSFVMLSLSACGGEETDQPDQEETTETSYDVRGVYMSHGPEMEYISVIHEEIPDVMNAMRMRLNVDDPAVFDDLEQGDIISFRLVRSGMSWFARDIEVLPDDTELDLPEDLKQQAFPD